MSAPRKPGLDRAVLGRILGLAAPYRRRFVWTGVLVVATSALIWVRPALIRQAVDVELEGHWAHIRMEVEDRR